MLLIGVQSTIQWFGDRVARALTDDIGRKLHTAGAAVRTKAYALAPKRTGHLAASINYRVEGMTLIIDVGAYYGMFVEFGTRRNRPHPYLRPALNEIPRVFGGSVEMAFAVPSYAGPVIAHQAGFVVPPHLTHKQRKHIATHLIPTSKRHYKGNVSRARLRVRHAG